jgi:CubicO group peptidase (beta-lactamase class C family)
MRNRFALGLLLLAAVPVWGEEPSKNRELPVVTPAEAGLSEEKLAAVSKFMDKQIADQKIAGSVVIISHNGKIGFFQAYGQMEIEAKKPMEKDTIFRLYSMSKSITTAAALILVDAGKLKLDDPVSKYLPGFSKLKVADKEGLRAPSREMTVKDLMLHTAGLTYGSGPKEVAEAYGKAKLLDCKDLKEMEEKLGEIPLAYDPGSDWIYSVSIDVLGRVVEVASGQTLDQFFQKSLFEPLGMTDTAFSVPAEKLPRFAANYSRSKDGLKLVDDPKKSKFAGKVTLLSGGGGLVGTATDYMRFLTMVLNDGEFNGKRILQPETVKLMHTNQLPEKAFPIRFGKEMRHGTGFSLGFSVRTDVNNSWDPSGRVGEFGWGGAASTHYWVSPKDKLIVITLEQIMPYQWDSEFGLKKMVYEAIQ